MNTKWMGICWMAWPGRTSKVDEIDFCDFVGYQIKNKRQVPLCEEKWPHDSAMTIRNFKLKSQGDIRYALKPRSGGWTARFAKAFVKWCLIYTLIPSYLRHLYLDIIRAVRNNIFFSNFGYEVIPGILIMVLRGDRMASWDLVWRPNHGMISASIQ